MNNSKVSLPYGGHHSLDYTLEMGAVREKYSVDCNVLTSIEIYEILYTAHCNVNVVLDQSEQIWVPELDLTDTFEVLVLFEHFKAAIWQIVSSALWLICKKAAL